jgi:poly(3-hydroxybutyrate) depolymerase
MKSLCLSLALAVPALQEPPTLKELEACLAALIAADDRTDAGRAAQLAQLAIVERAPTPDAGDLKAWRKRLDKLLARQRTLEKKSGRYHWWEDERRGFYIVGGETKRPKGLFVGLHGGGVGSGEADSSAGTYASDAGRLDWVGIFPEVLEKTEHGWTDSGTEEWVLDLIDAALRTWDLDPDQVWMGGHSMGGYGTWVLGARHADRFAGLVASAGAPTPILDRDGRVVAIQDGVVPNLRNVPLVVWQSLDDVQVPPAANQAAHRAMVAARERWGGYERYEYLEVDGFGHGLPHKGAIELLEKVADARRDPHPATVVWQPSLPWKRQFHWLFWERPRIGATVVARLDRKANAVQVEVEGDASGLCVLLSDELVDLSREVTLRLGQEIVFQGLPARSLAVWMDSARTGDPGRSYSVRLPLAP